MRRISGVLVAVSLVCTVVRADSVTLAQFDQESNSFQRRGDVRQTSLLSQVPAFGGKSKATGQIKTHPFREMFGSGFHDHSGDFPSSMSPGDVEAVICDCGDLDRVAGGFPIWPFFFVGAVSFLLIDFGTPGSPIPPVLVPPTSTPPVDVPPQVPEPDSFVLLLTGLTAIASTLRRKRKVTTQSFKTESR